MSPHHKALDIEALLRWAYLDELSKRFTSSASKNWANIADPGWRGGTSGRTPQRYDFGVPHPDAERIEQAVLSLPPLDPAEWPHIGPVLMGDLWALVNARDVLFVRSLNTTYLIEHHAVMGTRPHWTNERPMPGRVADSQGRARIVGECRGHNRYTTGTYCELAWSPSPIEIAQERLDYACWHRGLLMLVASLELTEHQALPPSAPAMPWEEPGPIRFVFPRDEAALERLPLKPSRPWPLPPKLRRRFMPVRQGARLDDEV